MAEGDVSQMGELLRQALRRVCLGEQRQRQLQAEPPHGVQQRRAFRVRAQPQAVAEHAEQQRVEFIRAGQQAQQEHQPVGFLGVVPADQRIAEQTADELRLG